MHQKRNYRNGIKCKTILAGKKSVERQQGVKERFAQNTYVHEMHVARIEV